MPDAIDVFLAEAVSQVLGDQAIILEQALDGPERELRISLG